MSASQGILVGADHQIEWMLEWWWVHYKKFNSLPVAFIDFGMSQAGIEWCKERGIVIPFTLSNDYLTPKSKIDPLLQITWESIFLTREFWNLRIIWFKKPFAMTLTPFQETLWLDLDCEIRGNVSPLLSLCHDANGIAMALEPPFSTIAFQEKGLILPHEKIYNAGVVVYKQDSSALKLWCEEIIINNANHAGDSDLFTSLLRRYDLTISEIPQIYNWRMAQGENPQARIVHWVADWGKNHIRNCKNI